MAAVGLMSLVLCGRTGDWRCTGGGGASDCGQRPGKARGGMHVVAGMRRNSGMHVAAGVACSAA